MKICVKVPALVLLALFLIAPLTANALSYTATITADNHYALYFGNETLVTFVGRNELGSGGSPGTYNWSLPEVWKFDVDIGHYIYVAAWSDDRVAQGWIGQFVSSESTLFSNTSGWEVYLTNNNLNDGSPAPEVAALQSVSTAAWGPVGYSRSHGSGPWGTIPGIGSGADWIWGTPLAPGSGEGEYQIFRTQVNIPEPGNMLLMGTGLIVLVGIGRRRVFKK